MSAQIIQGDALNLPLADETVDLVVTSPPYFSLRSYQDDGEHYAGQIGSEETPTQFIDALVAATAEMSRVLKPSGSIFVNLGDKFCGYNANTNVPHSFQAQGPRLPNTGGAKVPPSGRRGITHFGVPNKSLLGLPWRYAIRCVDDLGLVLRGEIIWSKTNGMPAGKAHDRVRVSHETWFHLTKSARYYSTVKADHDGVLPPSVWSIPTSHFRAPDHLGVDHYAAFPTEWPRRLIRSWCPPDGIVLDPFGGTGTTALVAHALGRHGISVDLSADYCRLAAWRTSDAGQIAAAMRGGKPNEAPEGMGSLLDLIEEAS